MLVSVSSIPSHQTNHLMRVDEPPARCPFQRGCRPQASSTVFIPTCVSLCESTHSWAWCGSCRKASKYPQANLRLRGTLPQATIKRHVRRAFKPRRKPTPFNYRPEIKQEDPLDLSISLSGGKETNKDSPSNCE